MTDSKPSVLVTGGAKRIGAAIARAFGKAGWHVVVHYGSSRAEAEALVEQLPSAEAVQCDLEDGDAAVAMVETLANRLADWRALINSAAKEACSGCSFPFSASDAIPFTTVCDVVAKIVSSRSGRPFVQADARMAS